MLQAQDFHFVLTQVLDQKAESPMHKELSKAGIDDVRGITSLSLKFMEGTPAILTALPIGHQQLLICFKAFVQDKWSKGINVHQDWQNLVTKDEFREFRISGYHPDISTLIPATLAATSSGHSTSGSSTFPIKPRGLIFEFKKGIKRDPAAFDYIKGQQAVG